MFNLPKCPRQSFESWHSDSESRCIDCFTATSHQHHQLMTRINSDSGLDMASIKHWQIASHWILITEYWRMKQTIFCFCIKRSSFPSQENKQLYRPVLFLLLVWPDEGIELPVLGHHSVPLGLGVQHSHDAGLLPKRVPSEIRFFIYLKQWSQEKLKLYTINSAQESLEKTPQKLIN